MGGVSDKPAGLGSRILLRNQTFPFGCHPGVPCFTRCCHNADMYLYPYDIIRMKRRLNLTSGEFLAKYTQTAYRDNPYFPSVMLKMSQAEPYACLFLNTDGCGIYADRPYSCRAYPLEPAMSRGSDMQHMVVYFLARHSYCLGHNVDRRWTVREWVLDQKMGPYHEMNSHWVAIDTIFRQNPWGEQGLESQALKMAYMACFNIDKFREFVLESSFLSRFEVPENRIEEARTSDEACMLLGFDWIRFLLTRSGPLTLKAE
jgi:Fe-S-cluster containining protein